MRNAFKPVFLAVIIALGIGWAFPQSAYDLFQKALTKEKAEGNLEEAIGLFQQVVDKGGDESLAAQAQLHIGICYEKLGLGKARESYQRVIDRYPRQAEAVKTAREKLVNLLQAQANVKSGGREFKLTKIHESIDGSFGLLSPDGKKLALVGSEGDIWVRPIDTGMEIRLTQTPNFKYWCFWSPDSATIAYLDALNGLHVVPAKGGEPKTLIRPDSDFIKAGNYAWPTGWSRNSQEIVCMVSKRGLWAIPLSGGEWRETFKFADPKKQEDVGLMALSPSGRHIAYESKQSGNADIFVVPIEGGPSIRITDHPAADTWPTWSFDGQWISFFSTRSGEEEIWVIGISPDGHPRGEPFRVFQGLTSRSAGFSWTNEGSLGISVGTGVSSVYVADIASGKETQLTNMLAFERNPRWSPDGRSIAFVSDRGRKNELWVIPSDGGEPNKITINVPHPDEYGWVRRPSWLPDGKSLVFSRFYGQDRGIWMVPSAGGAPQRMELAFDGATESCDVSPDGSSIAFDYIGSSVPNALMGARTFESDIYIMPLRGGEPRRITKIKKSGLSFSSPRWSPDGKWIAFRSMDWFDYNAGKEPEEVWVCGSPDGEPKAITKKLKGNIQYLSWSPDGKTIVFSMVEKDGSHICAVPSTGGEVKKLNIAGEIPDFSPDGKKIAYSKRLKSKVEFWLVENFLPPQK